MFRRNRQTAAVEHASCDDFRKIFTEDMNGLHLLAMLLTADESLAAECFVAGLEDGIRDNSVFQQWARSWSKRAIIKNAITAIKPGQMDERDNTGLLDAGDDDKNLLFGPVTRLDPLERFVFVMSVLEGYSPAECSSLLSCSLQEVLGARGEALRALAAGEPYSEDSIDVPLTMLMAAGVA